MFNSILASTIWRSDDKTRIVWITLLAMADKDGIAEGSIPGLADLARVSIEDCELALAELMAPDKYSRTTEFEGRRIEAVDGGWMLLNHAKYRAKMSEDDMREKNRQRQAKWREKHKNNADSNAESQDVTDGNAESRQSRHTEADTEEKKKKSVSVKTPKPNDDEAWFESLVANTLYSHIDVPRERRKAEQWISTKGNRRFTKRFFTEWLNRIEPPLTTTQEQETSGIDYNELHRQELMADLARRQR